MSWRERAKRILKKVGKVAITAATMSLGAALGGPAIGGIASFLVNRMGNWIGEQRGSDVQDILMEFLKGFANQTPETLSKLFEENEMDALAQKIADKLGIPKEDAYIGVHASVRDLQSTLTDLNLKITENHELIRAILEEGQVKIEEKLETLLDEAERTGASVQEMHSILERVEKQLDSAFQDFAREYFEEPITTERLIHLGPLQRQNVTLASKFEIAFDPDLYVNRRSSERAFQAYMDDPMPNQNLFLVLGNAGLGKTWLMAHLSAKSLEDGHPTFFVPLKQGLTPVTSLFKTTSFVDLVRKLDDSLQDSNQRLFLFLDGLDEMGPEDQKFLLSNIASCGQFKAVSIILSSRLTDWQMNPHITTLHDSFEKCIYPDEYAMDLAPSLDIETPVSIALLKFNPEELNKAAIEYDIPTPPPTSLIPLLEIPYILRLIAHFYTQKKHLPDPTDPEMLELFAGVDDSHNTILGRLGILFSPRDLLMDISEKILSTPETTIPRGKLTIHDSDDFNLLLSSGILSIVLRKFGSYIHITPFFTPLLAALLLQKYEHDQTKFWTFYQSLRKHHPGVARVARPLSLIPSYNFEQGSTAAAAAAEAAVEPIGPRVYTVHDDGVLSLAVSSNGQYFVSSSIETISVSRVRTGTLHYTIKALEKSKKIKGIVLVALSRDGRFIISGSDDSLIRIWDFNNGRLLRTLEGHIAGIYSVAVSPDLQYFASGSWDEKVGVWGLNTGALQFLLKGHKGGVSSVAISPNSRYIISGSKDETVRVWESGTGTLLHTLKGHKDQVNSVAVSPDGRYIISGSEDKTIRLWRLRTGELVQTLKGHKKWIRTVATSKDGSYVFSGSDDKTVKVWDPMRGKLLHTFEGHKKPIYSVVASPDGHHLLSGSLDKTVRIWPLNQIHMKAQ